MNRNAIVRSGIIRDQSKTVADCEIGSRAERARAALQMQRERRRRQTGLPTAKSAYSPTSSERQATPI